MKTRALSILVSLMLILTLFAQAGGLSLVDMMDREVSLPGPAKRIVALQPAEVEILYAIGAGELLVGRGEYCNYPPEALEVPSVQSGFETNLEQIIELAPDVVLMSTMNQMQEQVDKLQEAGIQVVVTNAQDIQGVYQAIALLGQVTAREAEAASLVDQMKNAFESLKELSAGKPGGTVYFEVSPLAYGLWTAGNNTFMNELANLLGLSNAFADLEGWQSISEEQVLERDPDYIVTVGMYFGEGPTPVEEIMARPGWDGLKAVVNQQVLNIDSDTTARPGPRLVDAAQELFEAVFGEAAEDKAA